MSAASMQSGVLFTTVGPLRPPLQKPLGPWTYAWSTLEVSRTAGRLPTQEWNSVFKADNPASSARDSERALLAVVPQLVRELEPFKILFLAMETCSLIDTFICCSVMFRMLASKLATEAETLCDARWISDSLIL
jgi:hypothetical protein